MTPHRMTQHYVGTKRLLAMPMTLGDYNAYRGWPMPQDEAPAAEGYMVEYLDGGPSNHPGHEHYISWSPKAVFEASYLSIGAISGMAAHEQRVIAEKVQLDDNLARLSRSLNGSLRDMVSADEFSRLCEQERIMREFSAILRERIAAFGVSR